MSTRFSQYSENARSMRTSFDINVVGPFEEAYPNIVKVVDSCPHLSACRHKVSSPGLLSSTHLTPRLPPSCASSAARPLPGL